MKSASTCAQESRSGEPLHRSLSGLPPVSFQIFMEVLNPYWMSAISSRAFSGLHIGTAQVSCCNVGLAPSHE